MRNALLLLIVMMIIPVFAFADQNTFIGAWSSVTEYADDGADFFMIWIRDDNRVFYLQQLFRPDKPGFYEAEIFNWLKEGTDRAVIVSEKGQVCSLSVVDENTIKTSDGVLLHRVLLEGVSDGK